MQISLNLLPANKLNLQLQTCSSVFQRGSQDLWQECVLLDLLAHGFSLYFTQCSQHPNGSLVHFT